MNILYTFEYCEPGDLTGIGSVFLAGPTPRSEDVLSWRPEIIQAFNEINEDITLFVPEYGEIVQDETNNYEDQCEWEWHHLHIADAIIFWVPRHMESLPGFTTNCEFGFWVKSSNVLYGRPDGAPKTSYLDWLYQKSGANRKIYSMIPDLAKATVSFLKRKRR